MNTKNIKLPSPLFDKSHRVVIDDKDEKAGDTDNAADNKDVLRRHVDEIGSGVPRPA